MRAARDLGWLGQEPDTRVALGQLARIARAGLARPFRTLWVTTLVVLALVVGVALNEHRFGPRFVLRVVEMDRDPNTAPRPKRHLRDHVRQAVFSNTRLSKVIEQYGLYPTLYRANPIAAVESFREDIVIDVYRNSFVEDRSADEAPRSAHIALRYLSADRRLALDVTRALGRLIVANEAENRKVQAQSALADADQVVARAHQSLLELRRQIAERAVRVGVDLRDPELRALVLHVTTLSAGTPDEEGEQVLQPTLHARTLTPSDLPAELRQAQGDEQAQALVELASLKRSLAEVERRLAEAERRKALLEVGRYVEDNALGLRFEVVDPGSIAASAGIGIDDLVVVGLYSFIFALPLIGLFVGALDSHIRNLDDVNRLGLPTLGRLRCPEALFKGYSC
jgi:hypothetical protein